MKNTKTSYEILEELVHACMGNHPLKFYIWDGNIPSDDEKALQDAAKLVSQLKNQEMLKKLNNE